MPRLSIAADASRVGGEKTMVFFFTWLEEQIVSWPCPQIIRDFAAQAEAEASALGATARDRWVYGVKNFFEDLSATHWWASAAQKEPSARPDLPDSCWAKVPRPARLSSHDFLVALDNFLRGAGLSLSSFASLGCISDMRNWRAGGRARKINPSCRSLKINSTYFGEGGGLVGGRPPCTARPGPRVAPEPLLVLSLDQAD